MARFGYTKYLSEMKLRHFIGYFKSVDGHEYQLNTMCSSVLQAFFLLTAQAIQTGYHYQLNMISDDNGKLFLVDDILKCSELITPMFVKQDSDVQ